MLDTPNIVTTDFRHTAVIRLTIPRAEIRHVMGPGIGELLATVAAQGLTPASPVFSHHLRLHPDLFDFEIGVVVPVPVTPSGRVTASEWPASTMARTILHGGYELLADAWPEFDRWIVAAGHIPAPDLWECYVAGPEANPDPATWRTELSRAFVA
jgi:effector-binding domain-containing protein